MVKIADWGQLTGPLCLFGGPYSNLQATQALFSVADRAQAAPICTGDLVAYCANPAEVVALFQDRRCRTIAGNCEKQLAQGADDCGCGFDAGSACDLLSAGWFAHANAAIGDQDRAWMARLPDWAVFTQAGLRFAVIHGGASDISRFLWATSPTAWFQREINLIEDRLGPVDGVIAGHCGIAFSRRIGRVTWHNCGAIGMPPNDGRAETQYAIMHDGRLTHHRLAYDACGAASAMQKAGLVQGYHTALKIGVWPSQDVLPEALRRYPLARG